MPVSVRQVAEAAWEEPPASTRSNIRTYVAALRRLLGDDRLLSGPAGVTRNRASGQDYIGLAMNPGAATSDGVPIGDGHPALRDVRLRQATAHATDRDVLVERVLDGYDQPGESIIPPAFTDDHRSPPTSGVDRA